VQFVEKKKEGPWDTLNRFSIKTPLANKVVVGAANWQELSVAARR